MSLRLRAQNFAHRPVKIGRLGHAHAVDLDAHNVKPRARKEINDVAGAAGGETKVIRLDEDEGALGSFSGRIGKSVLDDAAVAVGVMSPEFEFMHGFLGAGRGQNRRLEIAHLVLVVQNQVAVGVANGFAAAAVGADVADDGADFAHGFLAGEEQHHDAAAPAGLRDRG